MPRVTVTTAAGLALAVLATPAVAKHRPPIKKTWTVTAPVPYAVDGTSHCADGVEGASKGTTNLTLPDRGVLDLRMYGYVGDWVLELFDAKGRMIGQAASFDPTNVSPSVKLTYKKATPGQVVRVVACNVTGGPTANVEMVFTYR